MRSSRLIALTVLGLTVVFLGVGGTPAQESPAMTPPVGGDAFRSDSISVGGGISTWTGD